MREREGSSRTGEEVAALKRERLGEELDCGSGELAHRSHCRHQRRVGRLCACTRRTEAREREKRESGLRRCVSYVALERRLST
jgi:hypothetical protein